MEINVKVDLEFDKEALCTAISNALFCEFSIKKNNKKVLEMNLYDLANYLPDIIANEIIKDTNNILKQSI